MLYIQYKFMWLSPMKEKQLRLELRTSGRAVLDRGKSKKVGFKQRPEGSEEQAQ